MRTKDVDFIHSILRHPEIYPLITDDGCPPPEEYDVTEIVERSLCIYLSPNKYSLFVYRPITSVTWEVHANVLKPGRGIEAIRAGRESVQYMFSKTGAQKLVAYIPVMFPNVLRYSLKVGFEVEGISKKSIRKAGRLYDRCLLGLCKEDWVWVT